MLRCMTVVVSFLFLAIGSVRADVVLVNEGNPTAALVLGEQPTAMEKHAASELARYVEQMSGAKLAVYSGLKSIAVLPENVVLIGRAKTNEKIDSFVRASLVMLDADNPGGDGFVLQAIEDGRNWLVIGGSNDRGTLFGVYHLLEKYLKVGFFWDGDRVPSRSTVSLPIDVFEESAPRFPNRQNIQGCAYGYSAAHWNLDDWKSEIDWTVKKKLNMMQLDFGFKKVMEHDVYPQFGVNVGPLNEWDRFNSDLAKDACAYARSVGARPVTRSFHGMVSEAFRQANPDARYMKVSWLDYPPVVYIHPSDPMFKKVFIAFQKANNAEYGTSHLYETNPFPEVNPGDTPEEKLQLKLDWGRSISEGLREVDPAGVFVCSAWAFLYEEVWPPEVVKEFLATIGDDQIILNDIYAEEQPLYKKLDYFHGKPWGFSVLHSFGGTWTLHGDMRGLIARVLDVVDDPKASRCVNFYINPEMVRHNYFYFDLCTQLAWNPEGVILEEFVPDYAVRRYGETSAPALETMLWKLVDSVYSTNDLQSPMYQHLIKKVYSPEDFAKRNGFLPHLEKALSIGLSERPRQSENRFYETDMMDIALQYAGDLFNRYLSDLGSAYSAGDKEAFEVAARRMIECVKAAERITATRKDYMLALEIDKGMANPGGKDSVYREFGGQPARLSAAREVRQRTTVLVDLENWKRIVDYARKNAYELIKFYYRPRVEAYIDFLRAQMEAGVAEPDFDELDPSYYEIVARFVEKGYEVSPDDVFQEQPLDAVEAVMTELAGGNENENE